MYLVDSHCHILKESFDDIDLVIKEAKENNVFKMINCADSINSSYEVIDLSKKYKSLFFPAIGIHPENLEEFNLNNLSKIEELIRNERVIAIGEIGLDYYYTKDNKEKQIKLFKSQLKLAEQYDLPVIIHSREATKDTLDILKEFKVKGVIHSFSGSYETAIEYIKMGFYLGVNGVITFKNSKLKETIKRLSLDNLLIETDSPYLAPHPLRGTKNSPKNIPLIANFLSELFNTTVEEVTEKTTHNVCSLFDI